nr:MAG TPA: hypothetical protein [Caudoviricetes sp.]
MRLRMSEMRTHHRRTRHDSRTHQCGRTSD